MGVRLMLVIIDKLTRECIALEVSRKLSNDDFIDVLVDLFAIRGVPKFIRSDNGPEFIARRVHGFLESIDVGTSYAEPGSPWQNGYVESVNSKFRDGCRNCEEFTTVQEEPVITEQRGKATTIDNLTVRSMALHRRHSFISVCRTIGTLQFGSGK